MSSSALLPVPAVPSVALTPQNAIVVTTACEVRKELTRQLFESAVEYRNLVCRLAARITFLEQSEFLELIRLIESARKTTESGRNALHLHLMEHSCQSRTLPAETSHSLPEAVSDTH